MEGQLESLEFEMGQGSIDNLYNLVAIQSY